MEEDVDEGLNKTFAGGGASRHVDHRQSKRIGGIGGTIRTAATPEIAAQIILKPLRARRISIRRGNASPTCATSNRYYSFGLRGQPVNPIGDGHRPAVSGRSQPRETPPPGERLVGYGAFEHEHERREPPFRGLFQVREKSVSALHSHVWMHQYDARRVGHIAQNQILDARLRRPQHRPRATVTPASAQPDQVHRFERGYFAQHQTLLRKSLGTHRFQRAVSAKDLLTGISRPQTSGDAYPGLVPINSSFAETARWKRCVPRARTRAQARDFDFADHDCWRFSLDLFRAKLRFGH